MDASVQMPVRRDGRPHRKRTAWIGHDLDKENRSVDPAHTRLQWDLVEVLSQWARIQAEPWVVRIDEWYRCREARCVTRLFPDIMIHMDHVLCPPYQEGYDEEKCGPPPALLVEVLSPSTQLRDRYLKYEVYEAHGVQEYWILDARHQFAVMGNRPVRAWSLEAGNYVPLPFQVHGQEWRMESPFLGTQVAFIQAGAWNWWSLQVRDPQAKTWLVSKDRQIADRKRQLADQDQQLVQLKAALRARGIDPDALSE